MRAGRNEQEDLGAMLAKYPLYNDYWDDKRAKMEDIEIPTYILGSYSSILHTMGAFRAFEEIRHQQKWYVCLILKFGHIFTL